MHMPMPLRGTFSLRIQVAGCDIFWYCWEGSIIDPSLIFYTYMKKNSHIVRDWYNQNLDAYLQSGDVLFRDILEDFLTAVPERKIILDMGSGTGRDVGYFNEHGRVAIGIDFSQEMIHHAQKNFRGKFFVKDFIHTGFADDSFDAIWSSSALLTHLDKIEINQALDEVIRVVKPNGIFGGTVMAVSGGLIGTLSKKGFIFNRYTEIELGDILNKKDMEILRSRIFTYNSHDWIFFVARTSEKKNL